MQHCALRQIQEQPVSFPGKAINWRSRIQQLKRSLEVPADKTTNLYKLPPQDYKKMLHDNITSKYKMTDAQQRFKIGREAKKIASDLGLDDRIKKYATNNAFITLEDHKEKEKNLRLSFILLLFWLLTEN